ncbi:MAG: triose-phosphate isomerase [Myxococcales bacterium]|nr:triose-phosphate isomerase [Myxococcales bacterium]
MATREEVERLVRQVVGEVLAATGGAAAVAAEPGRRAPLVAANWKMNLLAADVRAWPAKLEPPAGVELVVCPPLVWLPLLREALGPAARAALGAQNVHPAPRGAFTGEHSCAMLRDAGASWVIVGHSERRALFGETDAFVAEKLRAALAGGLRVILCVGERLAERDGGATFRVLRGQLTAALADLGFPAPDPATLVVAYEPVWAIGTGRHATAEQAQEAAAFLRERLAERFDWRWALAARILYGGSVTPASAAELAAQPDIDGFLVGGASLDPAAFSSIAAATARAKERR